MVDRSLAARPGGSPADTEPFGAELFRPELFRIVAPDSAELPPRPALQPHWRALQAVVADGLAVIELMHDNGTPAEWFFDRVGQQSNDMGPWTPDTRMALRTAFRPAITALRDTLLFTQVLPGSAPGAAPSRPAVLDAFLQLGPRLRDAITAALQNEVLPNPTHLDLGAPGIVLPSWADPDALHRALSTDLQDRFLDAMRDGVLSWPSPIDGATMACTGAFTLDDFNSVFRFHDAAAGLDVFIVATEHVSRVAGLYVPAYGVVVSLPGDQSRMVRQHVPSLGGYMLHHLAYYADSLISGIAVRPHGFATFLRGGGSAHLAHQLWNELTAIDALVTALPRERLPLWLVPGEANDAIEFYGPIDVLYPEIAGRVLRGLGNHGALARHAYQNGLILFRATRLYIGEGLRRRVAALAALRAPAFPVKAGRSFMIGLRVENRTLADLPAFCALVIDEAIQLYPGCTIVFDGHNARGDVRSDRTIDSHREQHAGQSLLAVERGVVEAMRARFEGAPVTILDTLGEPLATSLAWAQACDGFVTPWGAGLAKYRWVANRPGFAVTSRWNLENKGDLGLYHGTAYMADPTPLVFAPAEIISDQPKAPMLVPFDHPSYWNVDYDPDAMRTHICAFLQALSGPPAALAAMAVRKGLRQGSVDVVDTAVRGWAISDQEDPVMVEIVIDDAVVGRVACDKERPDLLAGGFHTPFAGFGFVIPPAFLDGAPRLLSVRYSDGKPLPLLSPNIGDTYAFRLGHPAP